jgi:hypothetical protein
MEIADAYSILLSLSIVWTFSRNSNFHTISILWEKWLVFPVYSPGWIVKRKGAAFFLVPEKCEWGSGRS